MPELEELPWEPAFARRMKQKRELEEISQTELAKQVSAAGIAFHQQTVQRIEAGLRPVRLNEAMIVADLLNTTLMAMVHPYTPDSARQEMTSSALKLVNMLNRLDDVLSSEDESLAGAIIAAQDSISEYMRVCAEHGIEYSKRDYAYADRNLTLAQEAAEMLQAARETWSKINETFLYSHEEFMEHQRKYPPEAPNVFTTSQEDENNA